jgi:DNA-binding NtrC family response regulator
MARILVLDDVPDAVNMLKRILEDDGHTVFAFTEEAAALDFIAQNSVQLAILDIKLKKMSGIEVLVEIKKISPATRVIILTAYPTLETSRESMRLGAADYCVKPIDTDELGAKVSQVLGSTSAP